MKSGIGMNSGIENRCTHTDTSADVRQLVNFLAEAVRPEKIFLLNSPVPDMAGDAAYVELLVVMPYRSHILFREHQELVEFANLRGRHVSCSLHRSDAVREALEQGHIFYSLSCTPCNLVYDDGSEPLPSTPLELYPIIRETALKTFRVRYGRGQAFYDCARSCDNAAIIPFLLHQAAELTYRAILISLMEKDTRTHSIKALIRYSRRVAPQLSSVFPRDTPEEKQLVHLLDEAYLKSRYEPEYRFYTVTIDELFKRVKQLQEMVKQIFEEKVRLFE
ncbi:HEPN domain-containing protein [Pontibacter korlensis]|uniref:HEPN domain-containing protein n=1 Tax=Pontibacter korlensis TaxID=400092 RepID=A0A0E3UVS1_9BACT|nr:HEPN domain-containing protein [Pontibacter korlensis]AKD02106.1 hypothetical protein PKOR_01820 [Pontibacter korlensis]